MTKQEFYSFLQSVNGVNRYREKLFAKENGDVELCLPSYKARSIGRIELDEKDGRVHYVKFLTEKHIFKAGGPSWGLNEELVRKLAAVDAFVFVYALGKVFGISAKNIIKFGYYQKHQKQGFELQLFVNFSHWQTICIGA